MISKLGEQLSPCAQEEIQQSPESVLNDRGTRFPNKIVHGYKREGIYDPPLLSPAKILAWQTTHGGFRIEETELRKVRGMPLPYDQVCLLPLRQAKEPKSCAAESSTRQQQRCPHVPGTAARTPERSRQSARSASGTLGCGAPPAPAAQGNTSHQENHLQMESQKLC